MIPRPKGIFTLEEEGEKEHGEGPAAAVRVPKSPKPMSADLVGLRILIQCSNQESIVVAKSTVRSSRLVAQPCHSPAGLPELSFLKACYLCKKEMSPQKDVYMYRGDQGFCSVECRCQQILLDERREKLEAAARGARLAAPPRIHIAIDHQVLPEERRRILAAA